MAENLPIGKIQTLKNRLCDKKDYESLSMLRDIEKDIEKVKELFSQIQ